MPAELYLNYDCGLYSTNLYEELMKMFSKVCTFFRVTISIFNKKLMSPKFVFQNVSIAMTTGMHSMQLISLEAIIMLITGMEIRCKGCKELCKPSRHIASTNLPTREDLLAIKTNKRVCTCFYSSFFM